MHSIMALCTFKTLSSAVNIYLEESTDEQLTSQKHHETTDEGINHDFKGKSNEAAISSNLEFPGVPDHEVEVGVLVDGGRDAAVVIQELVRCDLAVTHCIWSIVADELVCLKVGQKLVVELLLCQLPIQVF